VADQAFDTAQGFREGEKLQVLDESPDRRLTALDIEADHAAKALLLVCRNLMAGM
jgi:hypothetical protein